MRIKDLLDEYAHELVENYSEHNAIKIWVKDGNGTSVGAFEKMKDKYVEKIKYLLLRNVE